MKTIAIENIYIETILTFCENAAELGCPRDQDVDMWFRYLSYEEQLKVVEKMIDIEKRIELQKEKDKENKEES